MTAGEPEDNDKGLLDTSIFVASEQGRPLRFLPREAAIAVISVAELYLGVLMADDPAVRAQRLRTFSSVEQLFEPLPIDVDVSRMFAEIVAEARRAGKRPKIMDTWIAATALVHDLPVFTRDDDFLAIPRVRAVRV